MVTYIEKSLEIGETPKKDNTEPSLRGNSLEGVTTIEFDLSSRLKETLEVIACRAMNSSNAPMQRGITTVQLQNCYDFALTQSRKQFKTSSDTKALCLLVGFDFNKEEIQNVRKYLFNCDVILKVGDRQCVDPKTKQKKSKVQSIIRSSESTNRIEKITQKRWGKPKDELAIIQEKQKKSLKKTLSEKMADEETWVSLQNGYQEKSKQARSAMTQDKILEGIATWKKIYWNKSDADRMEIQRKREKASNIGFYDQGIWFGSSFEKNMYNFLSEKQVSFEFHTLQCKLVNYTWHPDFYLPESNIILEVKGEYPKSKQYWEQVTLPNILKSNLCDRYNIRVFWKRTTSNHLTLEDLLQDCESVNELVCSH